MDDLSSLDQNSLKGALEALLLVSTEATSAAKFAEALDCSPTEVSNLLADLSAEYSDTNRGFQLREVAGGWRLFTHPAFHDQVADYILSFEKTSLSQAALETIAVIAYHQPITREGVRAIRGVNSDRVILSLVEKGLVKQCGKDTDRGQAILYGTTQTFLERFGLKSLRGLPPLEQFAPDEASKDFIRRRLQGHGVTDSLDQALTELSDDQDEQELQEDYEQR